MAALRPGHVAAMMPTTDRADADEDECDRGHRRLRHGVDITSEERPELSTEQDAQRYAGDGADECVHGRLPRDGQPELAPREAEGLQDGEVATPSRTEAMSVRASAKTAPAARPVASTTGVAPMER